MRRPDQWLAGIAADADTMTEARILANTPEWNALLGWLEFHGIDPHTIPAGTRVSRDECGRCIRYVAIVVDKNGHKQFALNTRELLTVPMIEQGEAPPIPYPDVIREQLLPVPQAVRL